LNGGVAVVTGATGAVGGAIISHLALAGMSVLAVGRTAEGLEARVRESGWKPPIHGVVVDLSSDEAVEALSQRIHAELPRVDVLVHAAGVLAMGLTRASQLDDLDRQYRVNVRAPYHLTQRLIPQLTEARGQVVFVNSTAILQARPGLSQYAASKHALKGMADVLRSEVNADGVRVLSVLLGQTASRMQEVVHAYEGRTYRPDLLIQPNDVAAVVIQTLQLPRTIEVTEIAMRPLHKT
jgi:NADP-dependent 3-hydroxy acid dehydrogenase YdfG